METFTDRVKSVIKRIPRGKVMSYGQVAAASGNPRAARQVVWVLHTSTEKERLPWHRVVNGKGRIALPIGNGYELQRALLEREKVRFLLDGSIDMKKHAWFPAAPKSKKRCSEL